MQGVLGAVASPAACADTTSGSAATSTTTATTPTTTSSEVRAAAAANASPSGSACEVRAGQQAFTSLPQQLGHPAGSGCTSAIHLPGNICSADTGVAAALDASEVSTGSSMGKACACGVEAQLNAELAAVRRQVSMRYAAILQDLADSLLALSDLRGRVGYKRAFLVDEMAFV